MKNLLFSIALIFSMAGAARGQGSITRGEIPPKPAERIAVTEGGKQVVYTHCAFPWGDFYFKDGVQINERDYMKATEAYRKKKAVKDTITTPKDTTGQ